MKSPGFIVPIAKSGVMEAEPPTSWTAPKIAGARIAQGFSDALVAPLHLNTDKTTSSFILIS
jgi:hypothetical protein